MSGARLTAALECANDAGVRFTLQRPGDSHGASRLSAGAAASCASADRPASAVRAALTGTGATPQAEGLVRARTQVCFHTPAPVPWGRSRSINPYAGRRFERRFEAADHPFADRPAVWQPGITEQGRGVPPMVRATAQAAKSATRPSQVTDGLPARDCWTGATSRRRVDGRAHPTLPDAVPGIERGGSLPPRPDPPERHRRSCGRGATATPPATCGIGGAHIGMAMPCTSTPMSMCTRGTPPTPAVRRSRCASWKPARTPCREPVDRRSGPRREEGSTPRCSASCSGVSASQERPTG